MNANHQVANPGGWVTRHKRVAVGLAYGVLLVGFLAADFVFSNIRKSTPDYMLHTRMPPIGNIPRSNFSGYYGVRFWDEFKSPIAFNNLGFRNDIPFDSKTTAGKAIVFAVGDSTTACLEVPLAQSYPAVLGKKLGANFAVFNAGARAYDTQQVIVNYLVRLRPLKPAAVVYLICVNDYNNNVELDRQSEYIRYFGKSIIDDRLEVEYIEPVLQRLRARDRLRMQWKTNFNLTSYVVSQLARLIPGSRGHGVVSPNYYTPETLRKMEQLLAFFDAETARDGARLYLAFMPEFENVSAHVPVNEIYMAYKATRDYVKANLTNTVFIPTFDMFREQDRTWPDRPRFTFKRNHHANAQGNRWLGETIAEQILATTNSISHFSEIR